GEPSHTPSLRDGRRSHGFPRSGWRYGRRSDRKLFGSNASWEQTYENFSDIPAHTSPTHTPRPQVPERADRRTTHHPRPGKDARTRTHPPHARNARADSPKRA